MDLCAGAQERGLVPRSSRLVALVDFMEVVGWVQANPFARPVADDTVRRITARGLEVLREERAHRVSRESRGPDGSRA